jgi:hypothetical protein
LDNSLGRPRVSIDFRKGGNSSAYTGAGWAEAEAHGRWTIGTESHLRIGGLAEDLNYSVTSDVGPYLAPPLVGFQDLTISVNGRICFVERLDSPRQIRFTIPQGAVSLDGIVDILLFCPTAIAPLELGFGSDGRRLGLSLWQLDLSDLQRTPIAVDGVFPTPAPAVSLADDVAEQAKRGADVEAENIPRSETAKSLDQLRARGLILSVGRHSYGTPAVSLIDQDPKAVLEIGNFCSIAMGCHFFVGSFGRHPLDFLSTYPLAMALR